MGRADAGAEWRLSRDGFDSGRDCWGDAVPLSLIVDGQGGRVVSFWEKVIGFNGSWLRMIYPPSGSLGIVSDLPRCPISFLGYFTIQRRGGGRFQVKNHGICSKGCRSAFCRTKSVAASGGPDSVTGLARRRNVNRRGNATLERHRYRLSTMKIRREQLRELSKLSVTNFETRMIDFLHDKYPESKTVPTEELRAGVSEQIAKARVSYGFETEQQLAGYVHVAWLMGMDFDIRFPSAAERLQSPAYTAQDKADWLAAWTTGLFEALASSE